MTSSHRGSTFPSLLSSPHVVSRCDLMTDIQVHTRIPDKMQSAELETYSCHLNGLANMVRTYKQWEIRDLWNNPHWISSAIYLWHLTIKVKYLLTHSKHCRGRSEAVTQLMARSISVYTPTDIIAKELDQNKEWSCTSCTLQESSEKCRSLIGSKAQRNSIDQYWP